MYYSDIRPIDVANGPGIRTSLFVSGCTHACVGCFNPETWDFFHGASFGQPEIEKILGYLSKPYNKGLSLLGGEPLHPSNQQAVLELVQIVKAQFPQKDIWCYTGYRIEELMGNQVGEWDRALLEHMDILVDGKFILAQKNLSLRFRGSSNQRILDVPASLAQGVPVLWDETSIE